MENKEEKKNVPKLRFPGFDGEWERHKLGDLTNFVTGKSFSADISANGTYIVMDMGSVSQEGNRLEIKRTDIKRDFLCKDDLIMPKDDIGGGLIIGRTAYIPKDNKYVLGDHVYRLRIADESGLFLHYQINSDSIRKQIMPLVTGSAQFGLNSKNIQGVSVYIPSIIEQNKVGELFENIDTLITYQQQKLEKLKEYKTGMLQKMFPKEGEKHPEIRFPGFEGEWKKHYLGEIITEKLSNGIINHPCEESDVMHINVINMYDSDKIDVRNLLKSSYGIDEIRKCNVEVGDIFLTRSSVKPDGIAEANILLDVGIFVYDDHLIRLKVDKSRYDPLFVKINIGCSIIRQQLITKSKTTAFTTIGQEDIISSYGLFPSLLEQQKISKFIYDYNALITLHQQKLEKMKEYKKGLLQQMFV